MSDSKSVKNIKHPFYSKVSTLLDEENYFDALELLKDEKNNYDSDPVYYLLIGNCYYWLIFSVGENNYLDLAINSFSKTLELGSEKLSIDSDIKSAKSMLIKCYSIKGIIGMGEQNKNPVREAASYILDHSAGDCNDFSSHRLRRVFLSLLKGGKILPDIIRKFYLLLNYFPKHSKNEGDNVILFLNNNIFLSSKWINYNQLIQNEVFVQRIHIGGRVPHVLKESQSQVFIEKNFKEQPEQNPDKPQKKWTKKDFFELLEKLKDNKYKPTQDDKELLYESHYQFKSFKPVRSDWMKKKFNTHETFKIVFDKLNEEKKIPLTEFYDIVQCPSQYYKKLLEQSFLYQCNNKNGLFYKDCRSKKVTKGKMRINQELVDCFIL